MDTKKMRECSSLLPDPGGEVVRKCLDEIEQLRHDARDFAEQLTEKPEIIDYACAECLPDYPGVLPGFRCARHRAQSWLSTHVGMMR